MLKLANIDDTCISSCPLKDTYIAINTTLVYFSCWKRTKIFISARPLLTNMYYGSIFTENLQKNMQCTTGDSEKNSLIS